MANIDHREAALDALVAYFTTALASASPVPSVRKGWPESDTAQAIDETPLLTFTLTSSEDEVCSPTDVDVDGSTVTYRVGYSTLRIQADLWCAYKAQREAFGLLVENALHNRLPHGTGLWIDSANYYGRPLSIEQTGSRFQDENGDPAALGEWRLSWDLECVTDVVQVVTLPTQDEIEVQATVDDGAETITIPE